MVGLDRRVAAAARPGTSVDRDIALDTTVTTARVDGLTAELIDDLLDLVGPHTARVTIENNAYRLDVEIGESIAPTVQEIGPREQAKGGTDAAAYALAAERQDARSLLRIAGADITSVRTTVRNLPERTGHRWVPSVSALLDLLDGVRWPGVCEALADHPHLLVDDAGTDAIVGSHLHVFGPNARTAAAPPAVSAVGACTPDLFVDLPAANPTSLLGTVLERLHGCARTLVWSDLATAVSDRASGGRTLVFEGARHLQFDTHPRETAAACGPDLELWRWVRAGSDPGRRHSAVQAATLAVLSAADLPTAAVPVLRNAQHLHDLSRQAAVAESYSTRRAAREAAAAAAREAAAAAREAANKAVERALVQTGAALAVVIGHAADVVSLWLTVVALGLLLILTVASGAVGRWFDLRQVEVNLTAGLDDLDQYREALSSSDIDSIRAGATVSGARIHVSDSKRWSGLIHLATAVVLVVLLVVAILVPPARTALEPAESLIPSPVSVVVP